MTTLMPCGFLGNHFGIFMPTSNFLYLYINGIINQATLGRSKQLEAQLFGYCHGNDSLSW